MYRNIAFVCVALLLSGTVARAQQNPNWKPVGGVSSIMETALPNDGGRVVYGIVVDEGKRIVRYIHRSCNRENVHHVSRTAWMTGDISAGYFDCKSVLTYTQIPFFPKLPEHLLTIESHK